MKLRSTLPFGLLALVVITEAHGAEPEAKPRAPFHANVLVFVASGQGKAILGAAESADEAFGRAVR